MSENVKAVPYLVAVSFGQYLRSNPHVIPAKAGIHFAGLLECADYELDSRFRGNDVGVLTNAGSKGATTPYLIGALRKGETSVRLAS